MFLISAIDSAATGSAYSDRNRANFVNDIEGKLSARAATIDADLGLIFVQFDSIAVIADLIKMFFALVSSCTSIRPPSTRSGVHWVNVDNGAFEKTPQLVETLYSFDSFSCFSIRTKMSGCAGP